MEVLAQSDHAVLLLTQAKLVTLAEARQTYETKAVEIRKQQEPYDRWVAAVRDIRLARGGAR